MRIRLDGAAHGVAIHFRHHDVANYHIGHGFAGPGKSHNAVFGFDYPVLGNKVPPYKVSHILVVIHHQDSRQISLLLKVEHFRSLKAGQIINRRLGRSTRRTHWRGLRGQHPFIEMGFPLAKPYEKRRSPTDNTLNRDLPPMDFDELLGQAKTDSGTRPTDIRHLIHLIKTVENVGKVFPGYAGPIIRDLDDHLIPGWIIGDTQEYGSTFRGKLQGVGQEIGDYLLHSIRIEPKRQGARR